MHTMWLRREVVLVNGMLAMDTFALECVLRVLVLRHFQHQLAKVFTVKQLEQCRREGL